MDGIDLLTVRFGQVSPETADAVAATADVERLRHLHRLAIVADSVEQFAQALPAPVPTDGGAKGAARSAPVESQQVGHRQARVPGNLAQQPPTQCPRAVDDHGHRAAIGMPPSLVTTPLPDGLEARPLQGRDQLSHGLPCGPGSAGSSHGRTTASTAAVEADREGPRQQLVVARGGRILTHNSASGWRRSQCTAWQP